MPAPRKKPAANTLQLALFTPSSAWAAPDLNTLPSWKDARRVAIDTETRDPFLRELGPGVRRAGSYVVGYSFAIDGGPSYYIPLRHLGGDNIEDPEQGWRYLRAQAADFAGEIVGQNLSYDLDYLAQNGVVFRRASAFRDIMLADALIYELHNSYSLEANCARRGIAGKDETLLREAAANFNVDPKGELWKLPARFVGAYGEADARLPLEIYRLQEAELAAQDLGAIWDLESRVLPILVKMRRRGVAIDFDRLERIEKWTLEEERRALEGVHFETGYRIAVGDVWKASALAPALESLGIKLSKTEKTGATQIDKALLNSGEHPVLEMVARARKVNKLRTTFAQSVRRYSVNGRIHCTLNQMFGDGEDGSTRGARFGRMSCEDPNLQQQPGRGPEGKDWRGIYIPEPGTQWACADFSQQEPRWAAHFAHALKLEGAAEMVRRYCEDPNTDNHQLMADITKLPRSAAKIVFLGIMYGEGGVKLCQDLGHPLVTRVSLGRGRDRREAFLGTPEGEELLRLGGDRRVVAGPEGQEILDRFDQNAPFVKKLSRACEDVVKVRGYIRTIHGRRCRFPVDAHGNYDWTYRALNRLIQGSSADQVKKAIVDVDAAGCYLQLQVHDELDFSAPSREDAERVGAIMRESTKASLPFKVDVECGPNWGEIS